jgi:multimeric flavodoxin WrbA
MHLLTVHGSPRPRGHSSTIADLFTAAAEASGATATVYHLNTLHYRGCQGCYACKKTREDCILRDDLTPVLEAMHGADVIVLATPAYFFDVSGQMKCFIDRWFSHFTTEYRQGEVRTRLPFGKRLVFIQTQGAPQDYDMGIFERYKAVEYFLHLAGTHLIRKCGTDAFEPLAGDDPVLAEAQELARRLCA